MAYRQNPTEDWGNLPHHVVLQVFQHLSLVDRARASSVCRRWNEVFHIPDLWRRFEFELNQPATSYLKSTHPELIQQIIKKHAQHLQYVSFKVKDSQGVPSSLWFRECFYEASNRLKRFVTVVRYERCCIK
ncbi:UNVERIFIED_CONTAM: hypothetical protein FKN15_006266 [Acipenser sinensis]